MYLQKNDIMNIILAESLTALVFLNKSIIILTLSAAPFALAQAAPFILFGIILFTSIASLSKDPSNRTKSPEEKFSKPLKLSLLSTALLCTLIIFNISFLLSIGGLLYTALLIAAVPLTFTVYLTAKYIEMRNEISTLAKRSTGNSTDKPSEETIITVDTMHPGDTDKTPTKDDRSTISTIPDDNSIVYPFVTPQQNAPTNSNGIHSTSTLQQVWAEETPLSLDKTVDMFSSKPNDKKQESETPLYKADKETSSWLGKYIESQNTPPKTVTKYKSDKYTQASKFNIYTTTKLFILWFLAISTTTFIVKNTAQTTKPIEIKNPERKHNPIRAIIEGFKHHKKTESHKTHI